MKNISELEQGMYVGILTSGAKYKAQILNLSENKLGILILNGYVGNGFLKSMYQELDISEVIDIRVLDMNFDKAISLLNKSNENTLIKRDSIYKVSLALFKTFNSVNKKINKHFNRIFEMVYKYSIGEEPTIAEEVFIEGYLKYIDGEFGNNKLSIAV